MPSQQSPQNEAVLYQVELIWGIHIQRNYIFRRRRLLDFLWVLKKQEKDGTEGGGGCG